MKYAFSVVLLMITITSCHLDYEDNQRLLIRGAVSDVENAPFADVSVEVYASGNFLAPRLFIPPFFGSLKNDTDLIGRGTTNNRGSFEITIPSPETFGVIFAIVNDEESSLYKQDHTSILLNEINAIEPNSLVYTLPKFELQKIVNATFIGTRSENNSDTIELRLQYPPIQKMIDFSNIEGNSESELLFEKLLPEENSTNIVFKTLQHSVVILSYKRINKGIVEEKEVEISANSNTNRYEYEF